MYDFLKISESCRLNSSIPSDKFGYEEKDHISITLLGTIKPGLANVTYEETDTKHLGEIMILQVEVHDHPQEIFHLIQPIFKFIMYQCLVLLKYKEKFKLVTCKIRPGKRDSDLNVLNNFAVSSWIHPDIMSLDAKKMIDDIRTAINTESDLFTIYSMMHLAISNFPQRGTSLAHTKRIIMGVMGRIYPTGIEFKEILQYCTPFEYHKPIEKARKYQKAHRETNHILLHDYEDIWYCLNRYEKTRKIIDAQQYHNMRELLYYIEEERWY